MVAIAEGVTTVWQNRLVCCVGVVISPDAVEARGAEEGDAFGWIAAVAHDVSKADRLMDSLRRNIGQHRFQGLEVGMDVADDRHGVSGRYQRR